MTGDASALALEAGDPEAFDDDRPACLKAVDDDPSFYWARTAWRAAKATPGAWYDSALADLVVEQWPRWATLTLDRFAGVPFVLALWQEIVVRLLVGWMIEIEVKDPLTHAATMVPIRLFRRLMLWVQRKNGKSEFLAALAWLFFALDGVQQGEGYVFASKEEQARIIFDRMAQMRANNVELSRDVIPTRKAFYVKPLAAAFHLLTGATRGLHGKAPTVIVGDEMHEWRSTVIADTLRQGSGGRLEPIELYASTAGRKTSSGLSAGELLYKESEEIADGRRSDPTTLVVIFRAANDDDPFDPATWRKANPNLGLSPTEHALKLEFEKARGNPRKLAEVKCYHLGIWADEAVKWIPIRKWDACAKDREGWRTAYERLKGRACYAAFDVSATRDPTSLVLVFPPDDESPEWQAIALFWIPEERVKEREADGKPVTELVSCGAMLTTEGDYVDQNVVGMAIHQAILDFDVRRIGFDPWNARKLYADLTSGSGLFEGSPPLPVELFKEMRQGIPTLGEPSKHFERLVFEGLFDHGGNPALRWMAGNVVVHNDRNLNFMPAKDKSADKIDGIVAAVMATGLAIDAEGLATSPWEDPEFKIAGT